MRAGLSIAATAVAWWLGPGAALAGWWIGPAGAEGPVALPAGYTQAVTGLALERYGFDDLPPGQRIDAVDGGRLILIPQPIHLAIIARSDPVAGALPASAPITAMIPQHAGGPSELRVTLNEPAVSAGFALIGLTPAAQAQIIGLNGAILGAYAIPAERLGMRRWIGMTADGAFITAVRIIPQSAAAYGIDDFETGRPAPEPAAAALLGGLALGFRMRRIHTPT